MKLSTKLIKIAGLTESLRIRRTGNISSAVGLLFCFFGERQEIKYRVANIAKRRDVSIIYLERKEWKIDA